MSKEEQQIVIYKARGGQTQIDVRLVEETVWLNQAQMVVLFDKNKKTISEHINNVYKEGELNRRATVRKSRTVQTEGNRQVAREIDYYNLDVIISVGYRVKSKRGTQFRIWANKILKEYLLKGYALNEKRLKETQQKFFELKNSIKLLENVIQQKELSSDEATGMLQVIAEYSRALDLLDKYDHQRLKIKVKKGKGIWELTYNQAIAQIKLWRKAQKTSTLFGNEKDQSFKSSIQTIYQTFDGKELYPSIEEKAANLLYFIVKNHSFTDGNKRIAAGIFMYFLSRNNKIYQDDGSKIIADNALVAITIMIAESKPEEKEVMVKLIVNLIQSIDK